MSEKDPQNPGTASTVGIVQCGSSKVDTRQAGTPETVPAEDLYDSTYFELKAEYAELVADEWFILSAEHGFVHPSEQLSHYDTTLDDDDVDISEWQALLADQLAEDSRIRNALASTDEVVFLAGSQYANRAKPVLEDSGVAPSRVREPFVEEPDAQGGIGYQMGWLSDEIEKLQEHSTDSNKLTYEVEEYER
jgi:hypothetical protein